VQRKTRMDGAGGPQDLRARGATHIDLLVVDGHDGLLAAVKELFSATPHQRCLVHKQRNVLNAIPRRERGEVQAELSGIWSQPTKQEAVVQLAAFKAKYSTRMLLKVCSVMYGSGLIRSTCSRRRPVAWQSSGQRSRISACTKSLCDAAEG
jgi:hypothetical protein